MLGEGCGCVDGQGEDHVDREVTPGAAGFHERQGTAMRWAGFEELLPAVLGERHEEKRGGIPVPAGVERRAIPPCSRKKRDHNGAPGVVSLSGRTEYFVRFSSLKSDGHSTSSGQAPD
jgi:hypothetical protein